MSDINRLVYESLEHLGTAAKLASGLTAGVVGLTSAANIASRKQQKSKAPVNKFQNAMRPMGSGRYRFTVKGENTIS